uniref:Uncharacterized protein n=1 Tax=Rhipicephalus appendiculatus TaxID=34631 RepID=A0A131YD85_RHIAP
MLYFSFLCFLCRVYNCSELRRNVGAIFIFLGVACRYFLSALVFHGRGIFLAFHGSLQAPPEGGLLYTPIRREYNIHMTYFVQR